MDESEIRALLSKQFENPGTVTYFMERYQGFDEGLKAAFYQCLLNGQPPIIERNGWSFKAVQERTNCSVLDAFLYMDRISESSDYANGFRFMRFGRK